MPLYEPSAAYVFMDNSEGRWGLGGLHNRQQVRMADTRCKEASEGSGPVTRQSGNLGVTMEPYEECGWARRHEQKVVSGISKLY